MTQQPTAQRAVSSLRAISNIAAVLAIVLAVDYGLSWWRGTPPYACTGALGLISDAGLSLVGMAGLLLVILGVMLGGAKHALTLWGLGLLVVGLLGLTVLSDPIQYACG